ncbi:MAG: ATP-binding protein [Crenarchaeota archaeon]|nr:ATP-binding protein [Thermoproteota archaeon]
MLFSPYPKKKRGELFGRERGARGTEKSVEIGEKLITIMGIRRIGKTSLINVFANEISKRVILIDVRKICSKRRYVTEEDIIAEIRKERKWPRKDQSSEQ